MNDIRFDDLSWERRGSLALWQRENAEDNGSQLARVRRCLRRARETALTPRQQQILELYYDRAFTMQQIADQLQICPSTVCRTLQRARRRLRDALRYTL